MLNQPTLPQTNKEDFREAEDAAARALSHTLAWLYAGKHWCGTDYAVQNYLLPWHPKFFCCPDALRRALNRSVLFSNRRSGTIQSEDVRNLKKDYPLDIRDAEIVRSRVLEGEQILIDRLLSFPEPILGAILREAAYTNRWDAEDGDFFLTECGFREVEENECEEDVWVLSDEGCKARLEAVFGKKNRHALMFSIAERLILLLPEFSESGGDFPSLYYAEIADRLGELAATVGKK